MKVMTIRLKLFLSFGSLFLVVLLIASITSYQLISENLEQLAREDVRKITDNIFYMTQAVIDSTSKSILQSRALSGRLLVETYFKTYQRGEITREGLFSLIRETFSDEDFVRIGQNGLLSVVDGQGTNVIHPPREDGHLSDQPFMREALRIKSGYIEYDDLAPGVNEKRVKAAWLNYFEPLDLIIWASIYKEDFATMIDLQRLRNTVLSVKVGQTGYPYIFTSMGKVIIHPVYKDTNILDFQDENGFAFIRQMIEKKNGWIHYLWKKPDMSTNSMKLVYFKYLKDIDWIIATGIYEDELYEPLVNDRLRFLSLTVFFSAIIVLLVLLMSRSFTRPIKSMQTILEKAVQGDLNERMPAGSGDEIGSIINNLNSFLDVMASVTNDIGVMTHDLHMATTEMTTISQEVFSTANEQAAAVSEVVATVEEFATMSKQIAKNASGVAQLAVKTEKDVEQGAGNVNSTLDRMKMIRVANDKNITEINKLSKKVEQINEVLKFINNIADQTKLIAFNAALEASSSSGESSKRFQIVAVEIRRLAESIVESISDIEDTINEIKKATHELTISFEQSSIRIQEGNKQAEETAIVLSTILDSSTMTSKSARQIDSGTSQQQIASDQIVTTLKEISDGIQQFVGSTKHSDDITKKINELVSQFSNTISHFFLLKTLSSTTQECEDFGQEISPTPDTNPGSDNYVGP